MRRGGCTSKWLNNNQEGSQEREQSLGGNENACQASVWGLALPAKDTRTKARRLEPPGEKHTSSCSGRQRSPSPFQVTSASLPSQCVFPTRFHAWNRPGLLVCEALPGGTEVTCDLSVPPGMLCSPPLPPRRLPAPSPCHAPPWPGVARGHRGWGTWGHCFLWSQGAAFPSTLQMHPGARLFWGWSDSTDCLGRT